MNRMFRWKSSVLGGTRKRMTEITGAYDGGAVGVQSGIVAETKVATSSGWRGVDAIAVGDKVLTFDGGLQVVTGITRRKLWNGEMDCPQRFWPLEVPAHALGNIEVTYLLPNQGVMVESDAAEEMLGDPFALIPAKALVGLRDIAPVFPHREMEIISLHFEEDQIVFANSGALFFCPTEADLLRDAFEAPKKTAYDVLPMQEALALASYIEAEITAVEARAPRAQPVG